MDPKTVQHLLDDGIPTSRFLGIQVDEVEPGAVRLRMPLAPQTLNHLGTAYAGAIFSLAEVAGGVAMLSAFDPAEYLMLARSLEIDYLRPGRSDLVCAPRFSPEAVAQAQANIAESGKSDLPLSIQVLDAEGQVVAQVQAVYYLRSRRP